MKTKTAFVQKAIMLTMRDTASVVLQRRDSSWLEAAVFATPLEVLSSVEMEIDASVPRVWFRMKRADAWNAFAILTVRTTSTANEPITHAQIPVSGIHVDPMPMERLPDISASANVLKASLEIPNLVALQNLPQNSPEESSLDPTYRLTALPMAFL
jgi:hypothetical protein